MSNNDDISPPPPILQPSVDINGNHLFQQQPQQSALMPIECRNFAKENLFAELELRWTERQKRKRLITNLEIDLSPSKNKLSRIKHTTLTVSENNRFSFGSANPRTVASPEKISQQQQKQFQVKEPPPPPRLSSMQSNASTSVSAFYSHSRLSKNLSKISQPSTSSSDSQAALKTTTPLSQANLNNFLSQTFMFPQPTANIANPMSSTIANILPQTSATFSNPLLWQQEAKKNAFIISQPSSSSATIIPNNLNFNYPLTQNSLISKLASSTAFSSQKNDSVTNRDQFLLQTQTFVKKTVTHPRLIASKQPPFNSNLASISLPSTTSASTIASDAQSLLKIQRNFKNPEKTVIGKSYKEIMLTAYLKYLEEEQPFEKSNELPASLGITASATPTALANTTPSNFNQSKASFNYPQISQNGTSNFEKNKKTEHPFRLPSSIPHLNLQALEQKKPNKMPTLFPSNDNLYGHGSYSMPSIFSLSTQLFYTTHSLLQCPTEKNMPNNMNMQSNFLKSQKHNTEPTPLLPPVLHRLSPPRLQKQQPTKAVALPKPRKLLSKKTDNENFQQLLTTTKPSFSNTYANNVINNNNEASKNFDNEIGNRFDDINELIKKYPSFLLLNKASTTASTKLNFNPEIEAIFTVANNQNKTASNCNSLKNIGISRNFYENCFLQNLNNPVEMPMKMFPNSSNLNQKTVTSGTARSVNTTDSIPQKTHINLTGISSTLLSHPNNPEFDIIINGQDFFQSNKTGNPSPFFNNPLSKKSSSSPTSSAISSIPSIVDVIPSQNINNNNFFGLPKNAEILIAREPEKYCFEENERKIMLIENPYLTDSRNYGGNYI